MSLSRKEKILAEIKYRLEKKFPSVVIVEGTLESEVKSFPTIFIFDDAISCDYHKRTQYIKILPLTVEYVFRASDVKRIRSEGQEKIRAVVQALELDEYLNYTKEGTSEKLALSYSMKKEEVLVYAENIVDVVVEYQIKYAEDFSATLT
mgnify:CR=1 FL=1